MKTTTFMMRIHFTISRISSTLHVQAFCLHHYAQVDQVIWKRKSLEIQIFKSIKIKNQDENTKDQSYDVKYPKTDRMEKNKP